jgi:hypothetical protein
VTPAARKPAAPPAPTCGYPIHDGTCGQPATQQLPVGYASNSDPIPLCEGHSLRFLGATTAIPK